jgi:hypothetical protein
LNDFRYISVTKPPYAHPVGIPLAVQGSPPAAFILPGGHDIANHHPPKNAQFPRQTMMALEKELEPRMDADKHGFSSSHSNPMIPPTDGTGNSGKSSIISFHPLHLWFCFSFWVEARMRPLRSVDSETDPRKTTAPVAVTL